MMWEGADGQVFYWRCFPTVVSASNVVSGRRVSPGGERLLLDRDPSEKLTLCYQNLDASAIAEVVSELTGRSIVVSQKEDVGARTLCQTGTLNELLEISGLAFQD
jgi:hypothetical protein